MKKQLFSLSIAFAAIVAVSCNNDSTTSDNNMSDSGSNMMSDDNMNTNMDSGATGSMTTTANNVGEADKTFMMEAASGGMMEVEAGRIAEQTASSARVKSFGTMMVQDHTNANNELKALASAKNVMLPDAMMAKHREHIDMLKKKTGKDFDKAYISMMVTDHNEDVSKFQMTSNNAADADVKAFASKTLPVLRMHLDTVKAINSNMKK